jgi:hypothetical protein
MTDSTGGFQLRKGAVMQSNAEATPKKRLPGPVSRDRPLQNQRRRQRQTQIQRQGRPPKVGRYRVNG